MFLLYTVAHATIVDILIDSRLVPNTTTASAQGKHALATAPTGERAVHVQHIRYTSVSCTKKHGSGAEGSVRIGSTFLGRSVHGSVEKAALVAQATMHPV